MEITSDYRIKDVRKDNRAHANDTRTERELYEAYLQNMALLNSLMMPAGFPVSIL